MLALADESGHEQYGQTVTFTLPLSWLSAHTLAGDLAVLGAAFGYSLATVRLEAWTSRLGTLQLAWAKSSGIAGAVSCPRF